ncbi:MAG: GNAT family N-acetyltransferase [Dactylosporangium sp.]|nr:GNAT family N-acetyltransferase [Dactylosporangium sp.]NNJ61922.1 GNAT family N-acetyltransferase [Dactylosporangium sp.]
MTRAVCPITRATTADVQAVAHLVAEAFCPLRASQWLVPDPESRRAAMAGQFAILVEHALTFGHVDLLADATAAAVWFHRTQPIPAPAEYDQRLTTACGEAADRFRALDALFAAHHLNQPHHHLAMLAVAFDHQTTGRGTRLLRHHHEVLDDQDIPAYLEAAEARSAKLYHREGYRPVAEPFSLPNEAFFYPMWRNPTQRRSAASRDPRTGSPTARNTIDTIDTIDTSADRRARPAATTPSPPTGRQPPGFSPPIPRPAGGSQRLSRSQDQMS